jgi:TPR repeat protein
MCTTIMQKNSLSVCNMCHPAVGADLLFYKSMQHRLQAARNETKKDELQKQAYALLKEAMEVNPGHVKIQNNLGFLYEKGEGTEQDFAKAAEFYKQAAEQGEADAQLNLGLQFFGGKGVDQSAEQAAIWIKKAATQGHTQAQRICEQLQL